MSFITTRICAKCNLEYDGPVDEHLACANVGAVTIGTLNAKQFPTYEELKTFIKSEGRATICQIRDHFKQRGEDAYANKGKLVAYNINWDFWLYLQEFFKEPYVTVGQDMLACMISDSTNPPNIKGTKFLPIVLSIDE